MKKLILACLFLFSCETIYTTPDGRRYKLNETCLSGHDEVMIINQQIGDMQYPMPQNYFVCDYSRIDTIWLTSNNYNNE